MRLCAVASLTVCSAETACVVGQQDDNYRERRGGEPCEEIVAKAFGRQRAPHAGGNNPYSLKSVRSAGQ